MLVALCPISVVAGCGGRVIVSEEDLDSEDPSPEAGTGGGGESTSLSSGKCVACDGQPPCAFCLVHGYNTTYVCPPSKSPPKFGCMSLGEQHVSADGDSFTCYYCN
jgi:hypothetical protein